MANCFANDSKNAEMVNNAKKLALFTICYNLLEGIISIYFGIEEDSISLLGFGIDSLIEVASAFIVLLKLGSNSLENNLKHERKATFYIGLLFVLLSLSVVFNSIYQLIKHGHPDTTLPGIFISVFSLSFMFLLYRKKMEIGFKLDSATIIADARCSLACIKLSAVLFLGSCLFWINSSFWWIDSVSALIIGLFILKEGQELINNSRKVEFKGGCGCH